MMLKLLFAVVLCGAVHRIDVASVCSCCDRLIFFFKQVYHSGEADNEQIICNDNALLGGGDEHDVVPEEQDNENLDFAKVLNIDEKTQYTYRLQIKEMIEAANGRCTYATDEEIQKLINDDNKCPLCLCKFTNEDRILGLVKITGCGHLFHALCFCQFYLHYKYVWCPFCKNGK